MIICWCSAFFMHAIYGCTFRISQSTWHINHSHFNSHSFFFHFLNSHVHDGTAVLFSHVSSIFLSLMHVHVFFELIIVCQPPQKTLETNSRSDLIDLQKKKISHARRDCSRNVTHAFEHKWVIFPVGICSPSAFQGLPTIIVIAVYCVPAYSHVCTQ